MALLARARSEGVDDATLDAAMDGQSPKADIVRLLLERHAASDRSQGEELQALREELEGLRVMALATPGLAAGDAVRLRPEPLHDLPCFEPMVTE